ncbi:hypothetical protein HMPREF0091_11131 [Fannyhessea vaginae DSM 15829]|uniref:Uncharacterized protein n=1 Tax=Fannyhessea vaginae DSM 15829 TaxID=525256 RepID=F1T6T0_9ACTN|nr:hypothetical protein HMPREF0091_11131 [Fannyhessea vaginae DSM 15829]
MRKNHEYRHVFSYKLADTVLVSACKTLLALYAYSSSNAPVYS